MPDKQSDLPLWLSLGAMALFALAAPGRQEQERARPNGAPKREKSERPFGQPRSSEEPRSLEVRRAREHGRGRSATHPLQIPWRGWADILWRTYKEMQSDRLLSIAGGVSFFALLAIFPAITALVSAYGMVFNPATITNNLSFAGDVIPANVL